MTTWFTSDLHLGHANIINYSHRPFSDLDTMNRALVDGWNDVVAPSDDVWVLGDFALGRIDVTLPLAGRLHGYKHLVCGNHDRCWAGHGARAQAWLDRYRQAGFDDLWQGQVELAVPAAPSGSGRTVLACHFPYEGDSHDRDRFLEARPIDQGRWLLHGHVHERWRQRGRMINVGVDAWGYRPVSDGDLADLIATGPADRGPLVEGRGSGAVRVR